MYLKTRKRILRAGRQNESAEKIGRRLRLKPATVRKVLEETLEQTVARAMATFMDEPRNKGKR